MSSVAAVGAFTDEQLELRKTVRALLTKHAAPDAVRAAADSADGYDAALWEMLCQQVGVAALAIPEEFGGIGASAVETHLVLEELGRTLAPTPMLGSVVLGAQAILASGNTEACERLLPDIAEGATIAALCWTGSDGSWDTATAPVTATAAGDGHSLTGASHFVLDGSYSDVLIVAAELDGEVALFEVDPAQESVSRRRLPTMDPTRTLAVVEFAGATGRLLTAAGSAALERVREIACVALSAEQVGTADQALANTVEYSKSRVQFGRPIGSFQALKHRMADLYFLVETARSASYAAVVSLVDDAPSRASDAGVAKVYCSEALQSVTADSIQLQGGIAITWEHDAQLFFKRAHGSAQLFGQPRAYLHWMESAAGLPA
ncbi:acyl-CoA dehydrogenase [Rhodococcus spelaei]|uniref:Acyl-CoA dehydrogenase n=1 Tax=Rhodococcus spelaei TaxID=2546320 RepID=A0A541BS11_9NOCA|nr:acyl-CoA dehydrogenase family protein [Rhodococcus spelaei]TQF75123.1 acyl-CoA dehydrogenase [Rhodococcus spelaei]